MTFVVCALSAVLFVVDLLVMRARLASNWIHISLGLCWLAFVGIVFLVVRDQLQPVAFVFATAAILASIIPSRRA